MLLAYGAWTKQDRAALSVSTEFDNIEDETVVKINNAYLNII